MSWSMTKPRKLQVHTVKTKLSRCICTVWFKPPHDKTNKNGMCAQWRLRSAWSESLLSAWRKLGSLATHWAHSAQADLSFHRAHSHFGGFVEVAHLSLQLPLWRSFRCLATNRVWVKHWSDCMAAQVDWSLCVRYIYDFAGFVMSCLREKQESFKLLD